MTTRLIASASLAVLGTLTPSSRAGFDVTFTSPGDELGAQVLTASGADVQRRSASIPLDFFFDAEVDGGSTRCLVDISRNVVSNDHVLKMSTIQNICPTDGNPCPPGGASAGIVTVGPIAFTVNEEANFRLDGHYGTSGAGVVQTRFHVVLRDETKGGTLFANEQISNDHDSFDLGESGGDLTNTLEGSLDGVLHPGRTYQLTYVLELSHDGDGSVTDSFGSGFVRLRLQPRAAFEFVPLGEFLHEYSYGGGASIAGREAVFPMFLSEEIGSFPECSDSCGHHQYSTFFSSPDDQVTVQLFFSQQLWHHSRWFMHSSKPTGANPLGFIVRRRVRYTVHAEYVSTAEVPCRTEYLVHLRDESTGVTSFRNHQLTLAGTSETFTHATQEGDNANELVGAPEGILEPGTYELDYHFEISHQNAFADPIPYAIGTFEIHLDPWAVGDIDEDGVVGFTDLLALLSQWGETVDPYTNGDVNGDGIVSVADLLLLLSNWS